MAGNLDKREQSFERKQLRKALESVDSRVTLPASLRGDALLAKLDGVRQDAPPMAKALVMPRRWLSLRSGFAYAAAFVLIVGLFYGLDFDKRSILEQGTISIASDMPAGDSAVLQAPQPRIAGQPPAEGGAAAAAPVIPDAGQPATTLLAPINPGEGGGAGDGDADFTAPDAMLGQGGILSVQLGAYGDYNLSLRPVDEGDPDRSDGALHVLEIIDAANSRIVSTLDIPAVRLFMQSFVAGERLALVGHGEAGVAICDVSLADPVSPVLVGLTEQPGELLAARAFGDVLHVVSGGGELPEDITQIELPDIAAPGVSVVTALDLASGENNQVAFLSAFERVRLFDLHAYLSYAGVAPEEVEEPVIFVAKVDFAGLDIALGNIT